MNRNTLTGRKYLKGDIFKKYWKILFKIGLFLILGVTFFVIACNIWVVQSTKDLVYTEVDKIPENKVGLVLGTSKYSRTGRANLFFLYRMQAAADLYHSGKVKHLILSGDNSLSYYNEPKDMKLALRKKNVPDSAITLDYAGFRTFDSVVRSKKVFNRDTITIVTQEFHVYRALFISNYYDIEAIGFVTTKVPEGYSLYTRFREYLARCKAVIDLYLLKQKPKFLGKKIEIEI